MPKGQIYKDREYISGLRLGGIGDNVGWWRCSKIDCVRVAQLCEYTKGHWIVYFKEYYKNYTSIKQSQNTLREMQEGSV